MKSMFYEQIVNLMNTEKGKAAVDYVFEFKGGLTYEDVTPEYCKNLIDGVGLLLASLHVEYQKTAEDPSDAAEFIRWMFDRDNECDVLNVISSVLYANRSSYEELFGSGFVDKVLNYFNNDDVSEDADDFEEEDN